MRLFRARQTDAATSRITAGRGHHLRLCLRRGTRQRLRVALRGSSHCFEVDDVAQQPLALAENYCARQRLPQPSPEPPICSFYRLLAAMPLRSAMWSK
jgi:hypothetical protein